MPGHWDERARDEYSRALRIPATRCATHSAKIRRWHHPQSSGGIRTMSSRIIWLLFAALLAGFGAAKEVSAHPAETTLTRSAPSPTENSPLQGTQRPREVSPADVDARALFGTALAVVGTLRIVLARRNRTRLAALSLLLIVSGFEGALHSVHHLDRPTDQCRVASSAEHLSIVEVDAPSIASEPTLAIGAQPPERPAYVRLAELTRQTGRAPPV